MIDRWTIAAVFLMLPFAFITPGLIWKSQQLFFLILPLFIVAASLRNRWIKVFLFYAGAWQIFLFIYAFNRPDVNPGPGLGCLLSIMAGAIVFKFVSEGKLEKEKWFQVIRIAIIMQVAISISQFLGFNPIAWILSQFIQVRQLTPTHLVGSIGNRNYLAAFVAFSIPMFIYWKQLNIFGWRMGAFLPFVAFMLIVCPSPGTVAAILGVTFYAAYSRTQSPGGIIPCLLIALIGAAGFTAVYVLYTGNHLNEFQALPGQLSQFFSQGKVDFDVFQGDLGRIGMWLMALGHLISSVPGMIFGFGPGAFWGREYPLHSEYMAVWFYYGLIGLFLMLGYLWSTWKFLWKSKDITLMTCFLIIFVEIGANHSFEIATTGMLGVIILGLIERERGGS